MKVSKDTAIHKDKLPDNSNCQV